MYDLTKEDSVWAKDTGFECHSPRGVLDATLKYAGRIDMCVDMRRFSGVLDVTKKRCWLRWHGLVCQGMSY